MNDCKIFYVITVVFVVAFAGFIGAVSFWPNPRAAEAAVMDDAVSSGSAAPVAATPAETDISDMSYPEPSVASSTAGESQDYLWHEMLDEILRSHRDRQLENASSSPPFVATASDTEAAAAEQSAPTVLTLTSSTSDESSSSSGSSGQSSSSGSSSGSAGGDSTSTRTLMSGGGVSINLSSIHVAVMPSMTKLLKNDISAAGSSRAELFSAKNETQAFQVIVTNPTNYALRDVDLHVSDWEGSSRGKRPKLTLYRAHYVKTNKPSRGLDVPTGWYPDALIPFKDPYTGRDITTGIYRAAGQDVASKTNQAYWADVRVDADVPAGTYTCSILVTSAGRKVEAIPVTLTVWDFALPEQRRFITWYYGFTQNHQYFGLQRASGRQFEILRRRYKDMAHEHGVYPDVRGVGGASRNDNTGVVTFEPRYIAGMRDWVRRYGTGIITIPTGWLLDDYQVPSATTNPTAAAAKATLRSYNNFSKAYPEFGKYVVYLDEPYRVHRQEAVSEIRNLMNQIEQEDGHMQLKMMLTGDNRAYSIVDADGKRCADLWVAYGHTQIERYGSGAFTDQHGVYRDYTVTLEELAESFLNDPDNPNAVLWTTNFRQLLDVDLSAYRDFSWFGYTLGATGGFGWRLAPQATWGIDQWIQSRTWINPDNPGLVYNGFTSLIYPGTRQRVGISGIGGPVATIRLKIWRRAVEDAEYFFMLQDLTDKSTVEAIVADVVDGYYTKSNPSVYEVARKKIAELILQHRNN